MRKLYSFLVVTLDGFYEGPNGEFDWNNTTVMGGNLAEQITRLKQQPGKSIAVFGSPSLTVSLLELGLVAELRVMVNPIVLGDGHSLFRTTRDRLRLEPRQTRTFSSGNVLLTYRPA